MIKLKPITDKSWIIIEDNINAGVLSVGIDKTYTTIYKNKKLSFSSKQDLNNFFQGDIFTNIQSKTKDLKKNKSVFVKGYPTNRPSVFEVDRVDQLPVYRKNQLSEILYSAGYFCVEHKNWNIVFCPKLTTLEKSKYIGPFADIVEARKVSSKLRNDNN